MSYNYFIDWSRWKPWFSYIKDGLREEMQRNVHMLSFFLGSGTWFYIGKHAICESAVFNRRGKGKHSRTVGDWRQK